MKPIVIGIAGTAKNTGKTTTTSAIMEHVKNDDRFKLAITSIGYDGEDLDNITGLPKPKIEVWPGVIAAIAEKCINYSTARIEILNKTDISTPLGKIIIGRVITKGKLVIAGPNKRGELDKVLNFLRPIANFIIVDGALNRIVPMVVVDGLILATGASKTNDIQKLANETGYIVELLQYPICHTQGKTITLGSIFAEDSVDEIIEDSKDYDTFLIKGIISEKALKYLVLKSEKLKGKRIIFSDMVKLLICGDVNNIYSYLNFLKEKNVKIGVQKQIKLIGITINPYYPYYRFSSKTYEPAYIDKEKLSQAIKNVVNVPVYNIVQEGSNKLFQDILDFLGKI